MKPTLISGLLLFVIAVSGCELSPGNASDAGSARAWFDAPLPGTVILPPNPCQIVAHGASPGGISTFELSINGGATSIPSPDSKRSLATLTRDCGLSEPGEYQLRLRVMDNGGTWSGYAETSLVIEAGSTPTPTPTPASAQPPVIDTPTFTPAPAVAGAVSVESVSSDLVYAGENTCGPIQETILARATAPQGIKVVVLFYRFEPGSPSGFQDVAMSPAGADLFQATINPTSVLGGPADATLQYQVVVQQQDDDTSIRTPVMSDVQVQACGSAPAPVVCSSYASKAACERHGCSWVAGPGIVPVFSCQNP